ncbi:MAG: DUF1565 domain-containing protein [Planctomycetota bacterium]
MKTRNPVLFAALLLPAFVAAQDPQPIDCGTFYVDPANGNDNNAGTLAQPLRTLRQAAQLARNSGTDDTIVLLPGEYDQTSESWPLLVPPRTCIQGTNALNTVLITDSAATVLEFIPEQVNAYDNAVVDGVTIVGKNRCVTISDGQVAEKQVRANPTFANCFLIDSQVAAVDIVVRPGTPWPGHDADNNGIVENRPKFINCTVITATIGILNRVDNVANSNGESEPGLLNCLFSDNSVSDLEGIDADDVISSAFATTDLAGVSPIKAGLPPIPVFNTLLSHPTYIQANVGMALTPFDLRLRPGSPAIDAGTMPALVWNNGTSGKQTFGCNVDIFDTDCEGYGNARVDRAAIDIGADESGEFILAGYEYGTTDYTGMGNSPFGGDLAFFLNPVVGFTGNYSGLFAINFMEPNNVIPFWREWTPTSIQNVRPGLSSAPTPQPPYGDLLMWIDPTIGFWDDVNSVFTQPSIPYLLPPSVLGNPPVVTQMNWQALPFQGTTTRTLTNLQSMFHR